jgi:dienelactone hydrolase
VWYRLALLLVVLCAPAALAQQDRLPPPTNMNDFILERMLREQVPEKKSGPAQAPVEKAAPQQTTVIAGLEVAVWMPSPKTPRPMPAIVFSHGFRGCNTQSSFLMRALADNGFIVLAPNHRDAMCRPTPRARPPELRFEKPSAWNEHSYEDRRDDLNKLLDAIETEVSWASLIDKTKIGLAGHDLGGYTVVGLAGGWESWRRKDVKAVLAMSPFVEPFIRHGALDRIDSAVMYQGGTSDLSFTPPLHRPGGAYDKTPAPVFYVELHQAAHLAWTDLLPRVHDPISHYALAFFGARFRGAAETPLHERYGDVADVRWKK